MAFDPFTNKEVMELFTVKDQPIELTQDVLKEYYQRPVMCLLRIKESIYTWEKQAGADWYFEFMESYMGSQIQGTQMNYSVMSNDLIEM